MYNKNAMLEAFIEKHFHNCTYDKTESEKIKNQTYYLLDNYSFSLLQMYILYNHAYIA